MYGVSHFVEPNHDHRAPSKWKRHHELPATTEFDELVVGRWLHVEAMNTGRWWLNVGGVTLDVHVDRDGRPLNVMVTGPGRYDDPVPGCSYELRWSGEDHVPAGERL